MVYKIQELVFFSLLHHTAGFILEISLNEGQGAFFQLAILEGIFCRKGPEIFQCLVQN